MNIFCDVSQKDQVSETKLNSIILMFDFFILLIYSRVT